MLFSTRLACITHRLGVCSSLSWASAPQRRDPPAQRQQYSYCREWGGDRRYRFPCHGLCWPLIWPRSKPNQSVGSSDPFEAGRIICAEMALCEFRQDILHQLHRHVRGKSPDEIIDAVRNSGGSINIAVCSPGISLRSPLGRTVLPIPVLTAEMIPDSTSASATMSGVMPAAAKVRSSKLRATFGRLGRIKASVASLSNEIETALLGSGSRRTK
jgi:hypothetical protein